MISASEEESRELMIVAAIRIVSQDGFEGFRTKRWATEAGVAEGSLYYHFRSKDELLEQAYFFIDREMSELCVRLSPVENRRDTLRRRELLLEAWDLYAQYLTDHPERVLYYDRFRSSARYTEKIREKQKDGFRSLLREVLSASPNTEESVHMAELLQIFLLDAAAAIALRALNGEMTITEETGKLLRRMIAGGIDGLLEEL